jgi:hypothetical protein
MEALEFLSDLSTARQPSWDLEMLEEWVLRTYRELAAVFAWACEMYIQRTFAPFSSLALWL